MSDIHKLINKLYGFSWFCPLFILLFTFLFYARTLSFELIHLDDTEFLLSNMAFFSNISNLPIIFLKHVGISGEAAIYRPILNVSFMFDACISSFFVQHSLIIFRITNILLFGLAAVLSYVFLTSQNVKKNLAFILTLFFVIHPSIISNAAWIYGRNDTILAVLLISCFLMFDDYLKNKKTIMLIGYSACYALALFTKEVSLFFLIIPPLYMLLNKQFALTSKQTCYFALANALALCLFFYVRSMASLADMNINITQTLAGLIYLPVMLGKAIFPLFPGVYTMATLKNSWFYALIAIIFIVFLILRHKKEHRKDIIFAMIWFTLLLAPTFINNGLNCILYEHRLFLPLTGLLLCIAKLTENVKFNRTAVTAVFVFSALTAQLNIANYSNPFIFWSKAYNETTDDNEMYETIGILHKENAMINAAGFYLKKGISLNPEKKFTHFRLAEIYFIQHRFNDALNMIGKEREINQEFAQSNFFKRFENNLKDAMKAEQNIH